MKSASLILIFDFPVQLGKCSIFDIGLGKPYIDEKASLDQFKLAYNASIKKELITLILLATSGTPIAVYFTGYFLRMLREVDPQRLDKFIPLVSKGKIEILGGTINHSLSSMYSPACFEWEIEAHLSLMDEIFDITPKRFYNTENIYFEGLIPSLIKYGFTAAFAGVVEWYLGKNTDERIFKSGAKEPFSVLLVDAQNQNKIFESEKQENYFLQFDLDAVKVLDGLDRLVKNVANKAEIRSLDIITSKTKDLSTYKVKSPTMGSIHGRTLASYNGEAMQRNALGHYHDLNEILKNDKKENLRQAHAQLCKSDIFLQLAKSSTLNPEPFDTYSHYMNMVTDLMIRMEGE